MKQLFTTLGPLRKEQLGLILPHEHVFVDLRTPDQPGYAQAEAADVVALMAPQIEAIKAQGVTALVECSTGGVGRRADMDLAVSRATGFPIVVPTGNYREPWIPEWVRTASQDALEAWMLKELNEGIDDTGVRAGWIKLSAGDDGITALETTILRAAARAAKATNAVIGYDQGARGDGPARHHRVRGTCREPVHLHPYPGGAGLCDAQGGGGARGLDRI
jgi:phosphotriesterase-related protein